MHNKIVGLEIEIKEILQILCGKIGQFLLFFLHVHDIYLRVMFWILQLWRNGARGRWNVLGNGNLVKMAQWCHEILILCLIQCCTGFLP